MHGLAAMVPKLRQEPGTFGLVTANGGFLSKHAGCVYSTAPYSETHGSERVATAGPCGRPGRA